MPSAKSNKEIASHIFQKYSSIRKDFVDSDLIKHDTEIVNDKSFVHIQLLTKCDIHHNALYKLLNVFRKHPDNCFSEILKNPYKFVMLADNILSFEKAHDIAEKFSLQIEQSMIYKAWIYDFILFKNNQFYISKKYLISKFMNFFESDNIGDIVNSLCVKKSFRKTVLYTLPELYDIELSLGEDLLDTFYNKSRYVSNIDPFISTYESENNIEFTKNQKKAIVTAFDNKLSIICGFPGTGKSTIADCICQYYKDDLICLTAPTGMAVNNIRNKCFVTNTIIGTIHKLLFDGFVDLKNNHPKLMIIDEFSMVDNILFYKIVQWCKVFDCKLVILADNQQLSPIGGGYPLGSMIESKLFKVTYLTNIKRQNKGNLKNIILKLSKGVTITNSDFDKQSVFFYNFSINNIQNLIKKYNLNANNCQFISPQYKHLEGTNSINKILQSIYSKNNIPFYCKQFSHLPNTIRENDMVVRKINNYHSVGDEENNVKELFANGDTAYIKKNKTDNTIDINYIHSKSTQQVSMNELYEEFDLAYCLTVHKVQGSQYDNVVLIIGDSHEYSWSNNDAKKLLYTAISRAKHKCFILGNPNLFSYAQTIEFMQKPSLLLKEFHTYNLKTN